MRYFLITLCAIVVYAAAVDFSFATLHRGTSNVVIGTPTCPLGVQTPSDGCENANPAAVWRQANAFQPGGFFQTYSATLADYTQHNCGPLGSGPCRPPWNVAGVDYPIGYYTPLVPNCTKTVWDGTCLLDPSLNPIPGCVWTAGGAASGGNIMNCTGSLFQGVISHINFGTVTGVNAHTCTALNVRGAAAGVQHFIMDDFNYFNDDGKCASNGFINNSNVWANIFPGLLDYTFQNFVADGNFNVFSDAYGGCASPNQCNAQSFTTVDQSRPQNYYYGVIKDFAGRTINGPNDGGNPGFTMQYSFMGGWVKFVGPHSEWYNGTGNIAIGNNGVDFFVDHSIIAQYKHIIPNGPGAIWTTNNWPAPVHSFTYQYNTTINSFNGAGTKTAQVWGCYGASITVPVVDPTAPICSGAGANFYVTKITGVIGQGQEVHPSVDFWLSTPFTPPDSTVLSAWSIDNGTVAPSIGPGNVTNYQMSAQNAGSFAIWGSSGMTPLGSGTVANNYMDVQSFPSTTAPIIYQLLGVLVATVANSTLSGGTVILGTSTNVPTGAMIQMSGISTACASLTPSPPGLPCPTVIAGSTGTTFALTGSPPDILTPQNAAVIRQSWCGAPVDFHGNVDMTGIIPSSWLNQWSSINNIAIGC